MNELTNAPLLFFPPITDCKLHQFRKHLLLDSLSTIPTCATKQHIVQHTGKTKRCHCTQLPIACAHFITIVLMSCVGSHSLSAYSLAIFLSVYPDPPEAPSAVRLSVSSSTSLRVDFQEPLCVNSAVVTKYKGLPKCPSCCFF